MPRDASGNYSLVAGNPVVTGTVIESTWANNTLADLAQAMTDSLSRNGEGGMLAPLGVPFGTALNASIFFSTHVNTGMYAVDNLSVSFTVNGTQVGQFVGAASGGLLVNNTLTGGGLERVVTTTDLTDLVDSLDAIFLPRDGSQNMTGRLTFDNLNGDTILAGNFVMTSYSSGSVGFYKGGAGLYQSGLEILSTQEVRLRYNTGTQASLRLSGNTTSQYWDGSTIAAQTLAPASGGLRVNNQLTGAGLERVLTQSDLSGISTTIYPLQATWLVINDDNLTSNVDWPVFNLPTSGVWRLRGFLMIWDEAEAGFKFNLHLPDDVVIMRGWFKISGAGNEVIQITEDINMNISVPFVATAAAFRAVEFECLVTIPSVASLNVNVLPEFAQNVATAGPDETMMLRGSYVEATYITAT